MKPYLAAAAAKNHDLAKLELAELEKSLTSPLEMHGLFSIASLNERQEKKEEKAESSVSLAPSRPYSE